MFLPQPAVGEPAHKKHKGRESKGGESAVNKMLWNLDFRTRTLEGKVPSYFLAESDVIVVPALLAAAKVYDDLSQKGVAHPMGPKRTTLAAGFLNRIATADLTQVEGEALKYVQEQDKIAELTRTIKVAEQQALLQHLLKSYVTAKHMEPEIAHCQFFKCKKPSKGDTSARYFFSIELQGHSPLVHCYPFIRVAMIGAGAVYADGPPPLGPQIRDIPR